MQTDWLGGSWLDSLPYDTWCNYVNAGRALISHPLSEMKHTKGPSSASSPCISRSFTSVFRCYTHTHISMVRFMLHNLWSFLYMNLQLPDRSRHFIFRTWLKPGQAKTCQESPQGSLGVRKMPKICLLCKLDGPRTLSPHHCSPQRNGQRISSTWKN